MNAALVKCWNCVRSKWHGAKCCLNENGFYYSWHHLIGKIGRRVGLINAMRGISVLLLKYARELPNDVADANSFPMDATDCSYDNLNGVQLTQKVALFAAFTKNGRIPNSTIYYLEQLRHVVDVVICVGDCPLLPGEIDRIRPFVAVARFSHHGNYDFGSYFKGYCLAKEFGILKNACELVLANDSCYGPIFPLSESFNSMLLTGCDFWGMTANYFRGRFHLQSYFYWFGRRIIESEYLEKFLCRAKFINNRQDAIDLCEKQLTDYLVDLGFTWKAYVDTRRFKYGPTTYPIRLMQARCPLVKVKTLRGESRESLRKAFYTVSIVNPRLYKEIGGPFGERK